MRRMGRRSWSMASPRSRRSQHDSTLIQCMEGTWKMFQRSFLRLHRTQESPRQTKETQDEEWQSWWIPCCLWNAGTLCWHRYERPHKSSNFRPWSPTITCRCLHQNGESRNLWAMEGYSSTPTKDLFENQVASFWIWNLQQSYSRTRTKTDFWMGLASPRRQQPWIQQPELARTRKSRTTSTMSSSSRWQCHGHFCGYPQSYKWQRTRGILEDGSMLRMWKARPPMLRSNDL